MPQLLSEFDASFRWTFFALANAVIILWTYKIIVPARVGWTRFTLAFPLFILFYLVFTLFDPERPSEQDMALHCALNYLWLTPWKLASLLLNRGPLVKAYESRSLSAFVVALLLNVNVKFDAKPIAQEKKFDDSSLTKHTNTGAHDDVEFSVVKCKGRALMKELIVVLVRIIVKLLFQLFFGYLYKMQKNDSLALSTIHAWYLYGWLSGLQDISQLFSLLFLNIKLEDNFNQPYLSDSFSDFWSRRWNLVMAKQLRELCYEPVTQGQWIAPRSYFEKTEVSINRRLIGIFLTFFASSVVHVLVMTSVFPKRGILWEYSLIFLTSPFIVASEHLVKTYIRRSESLEQVAARVPRILRIVFVHVCMQVMAHYTFFPIIQKVGSTEKSIDALFSTFKIESPNRSVDIMN